MKMKLAHYNYILNAFRSNENWIPLIRESIANESKAKDNDKRLRWDMLYTVIGSRWIFDNVYSYLEDSHIDTALRAIMREIESCKESDLNRGAMESRNWYDTSAELT
jgi:hypothetical protein